MNNIIIEAIDYIENSPYALLITVGEANKPFAREVGPFVNNGLDIYFMTHIDSEKVKQFTINPIITFYFQNVIQVPKEFKTVIITGTVLRVPNGNEFNDVIEKLGQKSPGYKNYIINGGFEIWGIYKMITKTLQFTDSSKPTRTVKIEI